MMEKATLLARKSKKGKLIVEIDFEDKPPMAIQETFVVDIDMNDEKCEFERVNGLITRVLIKGKELELKAKKNKTNVFGKANVSTATAPYNFVPLNKQAVTLDKPDSFDKYYGNTGYIDVEIKTKTPIYIRRSGKEGEAGNSDFYRQAGKYRIPGSSLRGMIRTMIEIASWSRFGYSIAGDNEGKGIRYFYRTFESKYVKNDYSQCIIGGDKTSGFYSKVKAGYFYKKGLNSYEIRPASIIGTNQIFRVEDDLVAGQGLNERISIKDPKSNGFKLNRDHYKEKSEHVYFEYDEEAVHKHTVLMKYAKVTSIRRYDGNPKTDEEFEGYLICSGYMPSNKKGKHLHWVIFHEDINAKILEISKDLMDSYKDDYDRIKSAKGNKESIIKRNATPCFYLTDKRGDIESFGFTGHFRIPYKKRITDFLPKYTQDGVDIAESIFGVKNNFMTRVFFEDALLAENSADKVTTSCKIPKILSGPKPTSFQLYLEQSANGMKNYNDQTQIRGNKLYWHQDGNNWEEDKSIIKKSDTQHTEIKPINAGAEFQGRIRFENLSDVEIGALLFVLDLPEGLAHKIGMAKPLGLGSIRINVKLYLSDRGNRYKNLFAEWNGLREKSGKVNQFKQEFEKYIINKIGEHKSSLWETDRLKELKRMLYFVPKPYADDIKYMDLKQFKKRDILPSPTGVK